MDRNVGRTLLQGIFQFLDEQPLAAGAGETAVLDAIALGHEGYEAYDEAGMQGSEARGYVFGLPQG
jgi:hypothetical protein